MSGWPRWLLQGEPAALAKYVLPDEVAALVHLPGPPADSRVAQAQAVYEALADQGITYSHEAPSDESGRQRIRQPGEVLWCPRHATCLDLALIMAGACLHSGLHPLVLILDPPGTERAAHALLGVWVGDAGHESPPAPDADVWATRPESWHDLVQRSVDGPPRALLLVDPVGIARPLPGSPVLGAHAAFADAVRAATRYADEWSWRLAVDIGRAWRRQDTYATAARPKDEPLRAPYVPLDSKVHRPLEVLKAEHAVVPFQGRDELTVLTHFCRTVAAGQHTGIALVHGVGGAGKTRLALELAHRLAAREGWYAGYLRENSDGDDWLGVVSSPTLVVLDYAEARVADAQRLLTVLGRRPRRGAVPAVLVMTARSAAGQWLTTLRRTWERDGHLCREHPPLALPPEHPDGVVLFQQAVEAFRSASGPPDQEASGTSSPVDRTTLDHVLLAFLAARRPDRLPATRDALYDKVLAHERDYWAQTHREYTGRAGAAPVEVLSRAVACLTLRAPSSRAQVLTALQAVEELAQDASWREAIGATLTTCLQPGPGEPLVLRPDPIADHLTLNELKADAELLGRALRGLTGASLLNALRVLNRAASADPGPAAGMLAAWIGEGPDRWQPVLKVAAEQSGAALAALTLIVEGTAVPLWLDDLSQAIPLSGLGLPQLGLRADLRRLAVLRAARLPEPATEAELLIVVSTRQANTGDRAAALDSAAEAVRRYRTVAGSPAHPAGPARALDNLAHRLADNGDHDRAFAAAEEAVSRFRALARTDAGPHLPLLALALGNLSTHRSHRGDHEAAVASVSEAVDIQRDLVRDDPERLPDLASNLVRLSGHLSDKGDEKAAHTAVAEAVRHYRALAATDASHRPGLAAALNSLSVRQAMNGEDDAALATAVQAVDIQRTLARANPPLFLPHLSHYLNTLSNRQSSKGEDRAALASITEAVGVEREFADTNPAAHLPGLAALLNNLANRQSGVGDYEAALASITEAVGIRRELAGTNPAAHLPGLARSLNNLATRRSQTGDVKGALAAATEAVAHYRTLAEANPAVHLPGLALALDTLSSQRGDDGDRAGALAAGTEAVRAWRELAASNPAAHLPGLALALNNLANHQSDTGDHDSGLAAATESVAHHRTLAEANPAAHLPGLALALNTLSNRRSDTGDDAGALDASLEAVRIRYTLAQANQAAHVTDLVASLNNLANHQSGMGDHESALRTVKATVTIRRKLADTNPGIHLPGLARSLNNLAAQQNAAGDAESALASATESVDIRRSLAADNPSAHLADLAMSLNTMAVMQSAAGKQDEALTSLTEAVGMERELARAHRASHLPSLAMVLGNLSLQHEQRGDPEAALAAVTEAIGIQRRLAEAKPSVHGRELARSLLTLAARQSAAGDHEGALASATESTVIRRGLAADNPAAHLFDLVTSLGRVFDCRGGPHVSAALWESCVGALEAHPLEQAEFRAHHADHLAAHAGTERAVDELLRAARAAADGSAKPLRRARHTIRRVALSHGIDDPRLPDWATHPLPDDCLTVLNKWHRATDWPATEDFLREHASRLREPPFRDHLRLLALLFPGLASVERLAGLLAETDRLGFTTVLENGRRRHATAELLTAWISTATWPDSRAFLEKHATALRVPEGRELLADHDAPEARLHLAILQLADHLPHDDVYAIVTAPVIARNHALQAVDRGDVALLRILLDAGPNLRDGLDGAFFTSVLRLADGDTEQGRRAVRVIVGQGGDTQRRAYAIHLRNLAEAVPDLTGAEELADVLAPGDT